MAVPVETIRNPRDAAHLGFASIALGGIFSLMSPISLLLVVVLASGGSRVYFDRVGGIVAAIAGFLGVAFVLLLAFVGFCFGIKAMLAAKKHGESIALGLAGAGLSALAFFAWVGVALAWYDPASRLLR